MIFRTFLVVMYMCLNVRYLKIVFTFHTKISDSIKNYVHYGEMQPHSGVLDDLIF